MKLCPLMCAATLTATAGLLGAQAVDYHAPQFPPKPTPAWVKIVDQGKNDPRLKGYYTPAGLKVEIVADYPVVTNPVGMTFGDDGTCYVLEWPPDPPGSPNFPEFDEKVTYKDGSTRKIATMKKKGKDLVKVLSDSKHSGVYDQSQVIIEDELPSSILIHDGWIYLSGRGTVRRYKSSKPGGPYDVREVIARGFCGFHHHQVSGLSIGNDGWLYITAGDDDNFVEGSDGSRATVLRTGAVFRCRPDGSRMHVYSVGYRNPYRDIAFDSSFNIFHADNDNEDGSKFTGCRLMHVAEGTDFGWRLFIGARCCKPDLIRGAVFGELPGKMPALLKTGRGAPAGLLIYNDTRFPENYRGLLYYPDVFRQLIRAYSVQPKGSTFEVAEEFEFMKSSDPLFRPCQMVLGPDGAIYVCDWRTNSGGAGQLWGDGRHGRIYRVTWGGTEKEPPLPLRPTDSWSTIAKMNNDELIQNLNNPEISYRQRARQEFVHRGNKNRRALLNYLDAATTDVPARISALGAVENMWNNEVETAMVKRLHDSSPDIRRLAADALALNANRGDKEIHGALLQILGDPESAVRRAVALAIGHIGAPGAADALVNVYIYYEDDDIYLRDGILRAIELLGQTGIQQLVSAANSGVPRDREKVIGAFASFRSRAAFDAIPELLKNPHFTIAQRTSVLQSYQNYVLDPPAPVEPVLEYLTSNEEATQVKKAGLEAFLALSEVIKGGQQQLVLGVKAQILLQKLLDDPDSSIRTDAIKALASARVEAARPRLRKHLFENSTNENEVEQIATIRALRALDDKDVIPLLKRILGDSSKDRVGPAARTEALRTLAAFDFAAAQVILKSLLDTKDPVLRREVVELLGTQPAGARLIGELFLARNLPGDLLPQVSDALQKHAAKDPDLSRLLTEVMKGGLLLSLHKDEIERVRRLVSTHGNPQRGKALYLNSKSLACVTCHRLEGVGGNVGPDLTRIWDTQSVEKIMEAIIDPNKEIKEGYQTYLATTKNGQVFTGLKVARTADEVILRDANAKDIRIPTKELDELNVSKKSLMPANVVSQLTFDQFIDLIAFLKDRRAQQSLQGMAMEFWVIGPFPGHLNVSYPPEQKPDPTQTYATSSGHDKMVWQARMAEPDGLLNLRTIFNRDHIAAYALTYIYSPKNQVCKMHLGSDDMAKVWIDGKAVFSSGVERGAVSDQDAVEVRLHEGWNSVLVKIVNVTGDHGLYLRFAGGPGLRVSRSPHAK